ncbi:hypothetical protein [Paenibacillus glycanilyticus]|uniref:Polysaccharide lyase 8 N-terminal alpha-helical domain-containing protein n=1 Tax=Paenibacillus glycanilyticus TaxID=126569 RepID=A0ABQ6GJU4_9BACL|nr:hypothetical protein [Paenibacillus glycanilyticus]GLX71159.1 hypothetical protein MU1_55080 [Paenibacillus glycanilyticus]
MVKLFKLAIVFALLLSIMPLAVGVQPAAAADELDGLRDKWKTMITGGTSFSTTDTDIAYRITRINTAADNAVAAFKTGTDRTACNCLFNGVDFKKSTSSTAWDSSGEVTLAFSKLREMALAYSTVGSTYYNDAALLTKIKDGVAWMIQNVYVVNNTNQFDNWWEWEIGAPLQLEDVLIMTYSSYTAAEIAAYVAAIDSYSSDPTLMIQNTTV